jgi:aldose 1-epimerase
MTAVSEIPAVFFPFLLNRNIIPAWNFFSHWKGLSVKRFFLLVTFLLIASITRAGNPTSVVANPYGKWPDGREVFLYTLTNINDAVCRITNYGGIVTHLLVPDKKGKNADVVLGFNKLEEYQKGHPYFGSNVGRVANRIAKGKFTLEGKEYKLATNNGPNALHGGKEGFDKKLWTTVEGYPKMDANGTYLKLEYTSKDGEEGYPGALKVTVLYTFNNANELRIDFTATTTKATPVNLAHHSYFNLGGHDSGDILGHEIKIEADKYTPTDDTLIPTGKIEPVKGTPFDFTTPSLIGKRIGEIKGDPGGYDLNYVLNSSEKKLHPVATVTDPKSGRIMTVTSTEPGVQFYTGNFLDGKNIGKGGAVYKKHQAFCLEPQHFPDSVNQKDFPSIILKPGETYSQTTVYGFSAK